MVLRCIILGLLMDRPRSGYDLKTFFNRTINFFWSAELSQIYRELTKLENEGYVTSMIEKQESRPDKKIYSATVEGERFFENWLRNFPEKMGSESKNEFLVRVFFSSKLSQDELAFYFKKYIRGLEEELRTYSRIEGEINELLEKNPDDREVFYRRFSVRRGIKHCLASMEWANECIRDMEIYEKKEVPKIYEW